MYYKNALLSLLFSSSIFSVTSCNGDASSNLNFFGYGNKLTQEDMNEALAFNFYFQDPSDKAVTADDDPFLAVALTLGKIKKTHDNFGEEYKLPSHQFYLYASKTLWLRLLSGAKTDLKELSQYIKELLADSKEDSLPNVSQKYMELVNETLTSEELKAELKAIYGRLINSYQALATAAETLPRGNFATRTYYQKPRKQAFLHAVSQLKAQQEALVQKKEEVVASANEAGDEVKQRLEEELLLSESLLNALKQAEERLQ